MPFSPGAVGYRWSVMSFWITAIGLAAIVTAVLLRALLRRGAVEGSATSDIQVYKDQLREVERDLARGVVSEEEAAAVRLEVSRRLLEADRKAQTEPGGGGTAPGGATVAVAALVAVAVLGGAVLLYRGIGAPGYPDLPLERRIALAEEGRLSRPGQAEAEARGLPDVSGGEANAEYLDLVARLREAVAERPDDLQGHVLLAQHEARLGNYTAAHVAQARVIVLKGDGAEAPDYTALGELMVVAARGYVSPEAEAAFRKALELEPRNGTARYYVGLLAVQTGRPDLAFRMWRVLLESSRPGDPWVRPIRAQILELALLAGVDYTLPAPPSGRALPGPTAEQMDMAGEMSPAERMEMIEGMVAGLSERLATEGGPPEEWARLIRAYGVLGRREAAAAIWAEAQDVFPDDINRVTILQAARDAGVAQ